MPVSTGSSEPPQEPLPSSSRLQRFDFARHRQLYALVMCVLFLACLGRYWMHFDPRSSVPRTMEMPRTAVNLYEKGQFANPFFLVDTGPSAHVSPAFPVYMALLMHAFGDKAAGLFALKISAALIVALQIALFPVFSQCLGMGRLTGFIAACAWIAAKPMLEWNWEGYYAAFLIAITCCVYRKYLDSTSTRHKLVVWLLGFLMGILMLLSPYNRLGLGRLAQLRLLAAQGGIFPELLFAVGRLTCLDDFSLVNSKLSCIRPTGYARRFWIGTRGLK